MSRIKLAIRNVILSIIFITLFLDLSTSRLTPLQAHRLSERSIHYGPSEVVEVFDHGSYQHILGTYDKWVSCNTVDRAFLVLWTPGSQVTGFENDMIKDINYSGSVSKEVAFIYGIVNNTDIVKIELELSPGISLEQEVFYYYNLFYFSWEGNREAWGNEIVRGYDIDGNLVYEVN